MRRFTIALALVALGFGVEGIRIAITGTTKVKGAVLGIMFLGRYGRGGGMRRRAQG